MLLNRWLTIGSGILMIAASSLTAQITTIGTKGSYPDMQIDKSGNLHLVYGRSGQTYYRMLPKNGTAFTAEEITGVGASRDHQKQPDVDIASNGDVHVLGNAQYNIRSNGRWGSAFSAGVGRDHHMTIAANGDAWIVYRGAQLSARRLPAGSKTFDSQINIYSGGGTDHVYPDITTGSDGVIHVVFRMRAPSNYDCGYVRYDGSKWSSVEWACLNGRPKMEEGPHVAVDSNNVPWASMPEGNLRLNSRAGGNWNNTIQTLSSSGHSRSEPTIGIDAQDNKFIAIWGGEYHAYNMATKTWFKGKLPSTNSSAIGFVDVVGTDGEGAWMVYEQGGSVNKSTGAGIVDLVVVRVMKDGSVVSPYGTQGGQPLSLSSTTISAANGGQITFNVDAGVANKQKGYVIMGSLSGTSPGVPLSNELTLPLNIDDFTFLLFSLNNSAKYRYFTATLSSQGSNKGYLMCPPRFLTGAVGVKFYFAYTTLPKFDFVSNAVTLTVEP